MNPFECEHTEVIENQDGHYLVLIRGIPGQGKSTLARHLEHSGFVHIETDMYYNRFGRYNWSPDELTRAHRWCLTTTQALLMNRGKVIVSNTFTQFREMEEYVEYAKQFGFGIDLYTMTSQYQNTHDVPQATLERMKARFESHDSIVEKIRDYQPR